jgi:hypothetical protein
MIRGSARSAAAWPAQARELPSGLSPEGQRCSDRRADRWRTVGAVGGAATTPSPGYYGYGYNEPGYYGRSYYGPSYGSVYYGPSYNGPAYYGYGNW